MPVKVSVVVPVYNPGSHIDDGIASLSRQSLPADEYEAIFVDDGSTDGTPARLDRLAAEHPNFRVIHIPNSGWPGRPRNLGLDAAQGEFVLFMDNDDFLGEEALERLYDRAVQDQADVVVGKVVGHGRPISRDLFAANRTGVDLGWRPLLALLTPHKLFRRAFLLEHGLRFPEGRVRLEDHAFVVPAFFQARTISVLADYPVYHWVRRSDHTNASHRRLEHGYWESLRGVLDVVEAHTAPGEERDQLLAHWFRSKMLVRLGGGRFARLEPDVQQELFEEIGAIARDRIGPAVAGRLRSTMRMRARLLEAGRLDGLRALAELETGLRASVTLTALRWDAGALRIDVRAALTGADGRPIPFERDGERMLRRLPADLPGAEALLPEDRDIAAELELPAIQVVVRARAGDEEYALEVRDSVQRCDEDAEGTVSVVAAGTALLDPATAAGGAALDDGIWDVFVEVGTGGLSSGARLAAGDVPLPPPGLTGEHPSRVAIAYATVEGNLSLDLGECKRSLLKLIRATAKGARTQRKLGAVTVSVPLTAAASPRAGGRPAELVLAEMHDGARDGAGTARNVRVPARLVAGDGGRARLEARVPFRRRRRVEGAVGPGTWLLSAATERGQRRLWLTLGLAADGSARIRRTRHARPRPGAVPETRLRRRLRRVRPVRSAAALVRRARLAR